MKITGIETIPITIPTRRRRSGLGEIHELDYAIVLVHTDEGLTGIGEVATLWDGCAKTQVPYIEHALAPRLKGEDPTSLERCRQLMKTLRGEALPARAAIDMALLDIAGKLAGLPAFQLIGGRSRESIVLSRSVHMDTPERTAEEAIRHVGEGFRCIKVKVGRDLSEDEAVVEAIRVAVGPEVLIRIDANMAWRSPKEAIRSIRRLEPYDLHSVEQPVAPSDIDGLRLVREAVDTPIMADESVWGPEDAWKLLSLGAVDMLNVYVAESGGLLNASSIFQMAEVAGVSCVIGAMPETGIGTSASVHLGVSVGRLDDPCDASGVIYQQVDIVNESFRIEEGQIWPLEGPGLGVTLNWEVVDSLKV